MRMVRIIVGAILIAVGIVWFLQGIDVLLGSPMTGETRWAVIGTLTAIAGVWLVASAGRKGGR